MLGFATMTRVQRLSTTIIKSVLALVLALNALGWAAHVDVPRPNQGSQSTHAHVAAYAQSADQPTDDLDQAGAHSDHCGHANAHHTGLLGVAVCFVLPKPARLATLTSPHYDSVLFQPPLDPPIA